MSQIINYSEVVFLKLVSLLQGSLLDFPDAWYLWVFWAGWYLLLTQPKSIDKAWEGLGKVGAKADYVYSPGKIPGVGAILAVPFLGLVLKIGYYLLLWPVCLLALAVHHTKVLRFAVTLAMMNFMVSERVANWTLAHGNVEGASPTTVAVTRYAIAGASLPLYFFWRLFLQSKEEAEKNKKILKEKGVLKGLLHIAFGDFLPAGDSKPASKGKGKGKPDPDEGDKGKGKEPEAKPKPKPKKAKATKSATSGTRATCPSCGEDNPADFAFCKSCGKPPQAPKPRKGKWGLGY